MGSELTNTIRKALTEIGFGMDIPGDYLGIEFSLRELREAIPLDFPTVFLSVVSGYLEERCILEYAKDVLGEGSSDFVQALALEGYEDNPDCFAVDALVLKQVKNTPIEVWEGSREKLFYAAIGWIYKNWDRIESPSKALFEVYDDFNGIAIGSKLSYYNSWSGKATGLEVDEYMKGVCREFLEEGKARLSLQPNLISADMPA